MTCSSDNCLFTRISCVLCMQEINKWCRFWFNFVGDGWLLAAIGAVISARHQDGSPKIRRLKEFDISKTGPGAVCFQIWIFGEWQNVVVDDRLPVVDGNLIFARSKNDVFWVPLMEKAFAKLVFYTYICNHNMNDDITLALATVTFQRYSISFCVTCFPLVYQFGIRVIICKK